MQHSCVVYNPIDSEAIFRQSQEPIDTDFPLLEGNPTLISVGRLVHQKGYERLLLIIKQLTDLGYNLTLNIIGEGTERPILEKKIKDLSLENQVRLLGFHKNPYPYIKASDIFVCSSYAEGFSTVITEALILGKAIVATNCSGIKEQLGECHEYGIVSENNNQSLFSKLKELISDPKLIEEYCRRAKKRGESFTLKTLLQPIEEDIL
jgi:glycosyltransferase involved in cell wall biosynthesis